MAEASFPRPRRGRHVGAGVALLTVVAAAGLYLAATYLNLNPARTVGETVDTYNGVAVYHNGGVQHSAGRNLAPDGYNLGIRYQCVEFVKRYYHQRLHHAMPDAMGHAKDFFDPAVKDGELNTRRRLLQYANGSAAPPQPEYILVFAPWLLNRYGHVAIVSRRDAAQIEIVQQNPGPFGSSREELALSQDTQGRWWVGHDRVLGWLRLPQDAKVVASAPDRPDKPEGHAPGEEPRGQ